MPIVDDDHLEINQRIQYLRFVADTTAPDVTNPAISPVAGATSHQQLVRNLRNLADGLEEGLSRLATFTRI